MDKQERAFVVWLNHRLLPTCSSGGDGAHGRGGFQVTTATQEGCPALSGRGARVAWPGLADNSIV